MKRIVCLALILVLCLSMAACSMQKDNGFLEQPGISSEEGGFFDNFDINSFFGIGGKDTISGNVEQNEEDNETAPEMPDFEGMEIYSVEEQLRQLDISYEIMYEYDNVYEEDRVVSQSIAPGTTIYGTEFLTLVVSMGEEECPYDYSQKLVVTAPRGSSYASASFYEWYDGDWQLQRTYSATVGSNGIGQPYEGSRRTPQGLFKLGVVISGRYIDTNMNTYYATSSTCVVDDPDSRYYNCIMDTSQVPYGTDYDPIGKGLNNGTSYAFIYIEHNGTGLSSNGVVPGAGSVMGIDGTYKSLAPTFGDVDISVSDMMDLLSRLDSTKNPMIEITTY